MTTTLLTLAKYALAGAQSEIDELAIYDELASLAVLTNDPDALVIIAAAKDTAQAIRHADAMRSKFRDLVQGQFNFEGAAK